MNTSRRSILCITLACYIAIACKDPAGKNDDADDTAILGQPPYKALTDSIRHISGEKTAAGALTGLYFRRAEQLAHNNLHELAVPDYKRSWELLPQENTGLRYAATLTIIGQTNEAARLLRECHRRYPANTAFTNMLGDLYQQSGQMSQALKIYDEMLQKDSTDFEAWYEKGLLLEKGKDTAAAIAALEQAFTLQPVNTYALELAHLYAETGNSKAISLSDQVLEKDLTHELLDPFFIKGIYYSNIAQYKKAIIQFDSCIRRDWKFTDAYLEKGIALFRQHKYQDALGIFQLSIKVSNTYPDGYYWIGRCYEASGQKEQAILFYQRAMALDKDFTEAAEAIRRLK